VNGALRPLNCSLYTRTSSQDCPRGCSGTGSAGNVLNPWLQEEKLSRVAETSPP